MTTATRLTRIKVPSAECTCANRSAGTYFSVLSINRDVEPRQSKLQLRRWGKGRLFCACDLIGLQGQGTIRRYPAKDSDLLPVGCAALMAQDIFNLVTTTQ
jgi:hypothetical protein